MWDTFNMGIGDLLVTPGENAKAIIEDLKGFDMKASVIGSVVKGERFCFA